MPTEQEMHVPEVKRCDQCHFMVIIKEEPLCSEPHVAAIGNALANNVLRTCAEERSQDTSSEYPCGRSGAYYAPLDQPKPPIPDDWSSWTKRTHQR